MKTNLSTAQSFIVDLAIASQTFLKECAAANRCSIDDLTEELIRDYAMSQSKKK
ncbi:MAG: hypothetical protein KME18_18180 [Phormidium tanganyikae FI6-MK23]|jgi:hypothetical protein|nr:hypothetical protein [Phormidium tanganyikae FI6-MK23]